MIELKNCLVLNMPMCSHILVHRLIQFSLLALNLMVLSWWTHGSPVNFSGRLYSPVFYGVERETGRLDYDKIQEIAIRTAKLIIGASAYS
jgi:glycine/serine hydroxymethyltransferase